jgi:hypothetical protein
LFHELAVGLKDAFAAVGQTPTKPVLENEAGEKISMSEKEFHGRTVLWEFIGNIDFVSISYQKILFSIYALACLTHVSIFYCSLILDFSCWH